MSNNLIPELQQSTNSILNDLSDLLMAKKTPIFPVQVSNNPQQHFPFNIFRPYKFHKEKSNNPFSFVLPTRPESAFYNIRRDRPHPNEKPPLFPQLRLNKAKRPISGRIGNHKKSNKSAILVNNERNSGRINQILNLRQNEELKRCNNNLINQIQKIQVYHMQAMKPQNKNQFSSIENKENEFCLNLQHKKSSLLRPVLKLRRNSKKCNAIIEPDDKIFDVTFGIHKNI